MSTSQMSTSAAEQLRRLPRFAESAVQRARLRVVPRVAHDAPRTPFVVVVGLLLCLGVAGLLCFNTWMQQASFTASNLKERADTLQAEQQSLQMAQQRMLDPQLLAGKAKKIGMVAPATPAFVELGSGRVLGDPKPADADGSMKINPPRPAKPKTLAPRPKVVHMTVPRHAATGSGAEDPVSGRKYTSDQSPQPR